jgi:ABC-2 type transport system permease protein
MAIPVNRRATSVHGPSALGGSSRRFVELTLTIARTDFKLRYFGSTLGYLWSLMRPLLFFGVIYVFFTQILHVGKGIPHYGVYLLTGIVLWTFFGEATGNAVSSLVAREPLLRKVRFPRLAIPLAVTLTSVFNLAMNFIAVFVFALINGVYPKLSWLWLVPIVVGFVIITLGLGMLLSALYVRFRDVQPIWEVLVQVLFYASPIMYVASSYKGFEHLAMLNPFALMLTQMGHAFVHPQNYYATVAGSMCSHAAPGCMLQHPMRSAYASAGGLAHVLVSIALIPAVFALGVWVFSREAPYFAENL